jgi:hypothetical protein
VHPIELPLEAAKLFGYCLIVVKTATIPPPLTLIIHQQATIIVNHKETIRLPPQSLFHPIQLFEKA